MELSVGDLEALQERWSGGVRGLVGGSENLEAPQALRSGGVLGVMNDSEVVEELICGGVVGLVGPTMLVLRSG